jgi:hypothetical protein
MSSELEHAINQVYQKVGRNVVYFHKLESMLKRLTGGNQISGYVSEIKKNAQKQIESVKKQTLGQVTALFIENNAVDNIKFGPDNPKEVWMSFGHSMSHVDTEERKKVLTALIEERNKLIHQLDQVCDLASIESCNQAEKYLDQQYDLVISEIRDLDCAEQALHRGLQALMLPPTQDMLNHCDLLIYLQERPSIRLLGNLTLQNKGTDGWTILDKAESKLDQEASDEVSTLKKMLNCRTLKEILQKTEVFEFREETTPKGGIRQLYRVKPDCSVWVTDNVLILKREVRLQQILPRI